MKTENKSRSRRKTPWDNLTVLTPSQVFLYSLTNALYNSHHKQLSETGEAELINSYQPECCPRCSSIHFKKNGFDRSGIRSYYCLDCKKRFNVLTGTIFENHKISIFEWVEYWRNLFQYESLNANSWNLRNAFTTAKYWFLKTALILKDVQKKTVLSGTIYYDETYIALREEDLQLHEDGKKLRGHSKNQMCIAVAIDESHVYAKFICYGNPTQEIVYEALKDHIVPGSTLITDKDPAHRRLVKELHLQNKEYNSKECKQMNDKDNPLTPINHVHSLLQKFLRAHSGFNRDELQDYLNIFSVIYNPPENKLEKIDLLLNKAIASHQTLTYRDAFDEDISKF